MLYTEMQFLSSSLGMNTRVLALIPQDRLFAVYGKDKSSSTRHFLHIEDFFPDSPRLVKQILETKSVGQKSKPQKV